MSHVTRKLPMEVCDQVRFKPACSASEASLSPKFFVHKYYRCYLSKEWMTKVLFKQHGCAGWSAPLLYPYGIRQIFSWRDSSDSKQVPLTTWNDNRIFGFNFNEAPCTDKHCVPRPPELLQNLVFLQTLSATVLSSTPPNWKTCSKQKAVLFPEYFS